jgi:hypothetical protein
MVDRLSPIDRNLKAPRPVRRTAENRKTPPLARRAELLGTIALHWKMPTLRRSYFFKSVSISGICSRTVRM